MNYVLIKDANGFFSQVTEEEYNLQKETVHLPKNEVKLNKPAEIPPKPEIKKPMVKK